MTTSETARPDAGTATGAPDRGAASRGSVWKYTASNSLRKFSLNHGTDLAAALTYYSVQALFPALLALVSLLGVFGNATTTTNTLLDLIHKFVPGAATNSIQPVITNMVNAKGSGIALVIGILVATWSASGYVRAFGRAMNRIYEVPEGRPMWKLRLSMFVLTIVIEVMAALVLAALAVSGTVAQAVFSLIGIGSVGLLVWNIAKWPVLLFVVMVIIALLYSFTPNVKQPRFRWLSIGASVALVVWIVISTLFGFYVANFGRYNKTYGTLAGVIIMLLWLWITNVALLLGSQVDAEVYRTKQLEAGVAAERTVQIPLKDDAAVEKADRKEAKSEQAGRRIRLDATEGSNGTPDTGKIRRRRAELDEDGFAAGSENR